MASMEAMVDMVGEGGMVEVTGTEGTVMEVVVDMAVEVAAMGPMEGMVVVMSMEDMVVMAATMEEEEEEEVVEEGEVSVLCSLCFLEVQELISCSNCYSAFTYFLLLHLCSSLQAIQGMGL